MCFGSAQQGAHRLQFLAVVTAVFALAFFQPRRGFFLVGLNAHCVNTLAAAFASTGTHHWIASAFSFGIARIVLRALVLVIAGRANWRMPNISTHAADALIRCACVVIKRTAEAILSRSVDASL